MRGTNSEHGRFRKYVTQQEIEKLLEAVGVNEYALRDRALILVGFHRGFRVSELVDLTWQDVDLDQGTIHCRRLKRGRTTVQKLTTAELQQLQELRSRHPDETYVFPSGRGGKMTRYNVNRMLKTAGKAAGVEVCNPHALRHGCGYELATRGVDTRRLQLHLGLRSLEIAATYTDPLLRGRCATSGIDSLVLSRKVVHYPGALTLSRLCQWMYVLSRY